MKKTILLTALLSLAFALHANGDPVAERSALTLSRTPVAVHVPEVKLLDEHCVFTLHDGYTEVEVRYLLHNQSTKDFKALPYGFPVDWLGEGPSHWESRDIWTESIVERGWRDSYVRDVMFSLNGRSLPWQCSADTILRPSFAVCDTDFITEMRWGIDSGRWVEDPLLAPDIDAYHYSAARTQQIIAKYGDSILYYDPALCRRWYYVRLDISAGEVVELKVRYRIENNTGQGLYEEQREFRDYRYLGNEFHYDFSPAAYWGDGFVQRFRVEVDNSDVYWHRLSDPSADYGKVTVKGLPMQEAGERLFYETRNFNFTTAEPLEITYVTERIREELPDLLSRRISPDHYTITVSGVDPKYPVANLSDMDLSTATVLRPNNRDSLYITVTFHDSVTLTGMLLYNGYSKDRQTWLNNSRIDSVGGKDVYQWCINYGSEPKAFTWQGLTDAAIRIPFADRKMDYVFPWGWKDRRQKVKEITVAVTAVKPGAKYNDLCVSEIILIGD